MPAVCSARPLLSDAPCAGYGVAGCRNRGRAGAACVGGACDGVARASSRACGVRRSRRGIVPIRIASEVNHRTSSSNRFNNPKDALHDPRQSNLRSLDVFVPHAIDSFDDLVVVDVEVEYCLDGFVQGCGDGGLGGELVGCAKASVTPNLALFGAKWPVNR
jgi:hypothetical protein